MAAAYRLLRALTGCLLLLMASADHHTMATPLASANTHLGRGVFSELAPVYDNMVISPFSLHSALTMTSMAAAGQTKQEMTQVLGLSSMTDDAVNKAYMDLMGTFNDTGTVDAVTANAIFQNPRYSITQEFKDIVSQNYGAMANMLNFSDPEGAEAMVNNYVEEKTNNMIENLFAKGAFSEDSTKLVLVNTLFFNGSWSLPFDKTDTKKEDFHVTMDEKVKVDMMTRKGFYDLKFGDDFNVLKVPFEGRRFSLYFVVPNDTITLNNPKCLTDAYPDMFFSDLNNTNANIYIPKFEIKFKKSLPMVLQSLGMKRAFTVNAEFPKIDASTMLSDVLQQAVIEVREEGTVAAAATGVIAVVTSVQIPQVLPDFRVDRPFLFFLRDDTSKTILFQGKFSRPQADPKAFAAEVKRNVPVCAGRSGGNGAAPLSLALIGWVLSLFTCLTALKSV